MSNWKSYSFPPNFKLQSKKIFWEPTKVLKSSLKLKRCWEFLPCIIPMWDIVREWTRWLHSWCKMGFGEMSPFLYLSISQKTYCLANIIAAWTQSWPTWEYSMKYSTLPILNAMQKWKSSLNKWITVISQWYPSFCSGSSAYFVMITLIKKSPRSSGISFFCRELQYCLKQELLCLIFCSHI